MAIKFWTNYWYMQKCAWISETLYCTKEANKKWKYILYDSTYIEEQAKLTDGDESQNGGYVWMWRGVFWLGRGQKGIFWGSGKCSVSMQR